MTTETTWLEAETEEITRLLADLRIEDVTRKMVLHLSKEESLIHEALRFWYRGRVTWEQLMMYCVVWLIIMLKGTRDEILKGEMEKPVNLPQVKLDADVQKLIRENCDEDGRVSEAGLEILTLIMEGHGFKVVRARGSD